MTPGAQRVLSDLANDEDCDLVQEGRAVWCGDRQTTTRVLNELLWMVAVSVSWREGRATYYTINETGRAILRRPALEREIGAAIMGQKPFSVVGDKVVYI